MKRWIKRLLVSGLIFVGILAALLLSLAGIARSRGVRAVIPPAPSLIATRVAGADYVDAYRVEVPLGRFRNLDDVIASAFQKGQLVDRSATEVVYQDGAPGLVFDVAYQLIPSGGHAALTMTTTVRYLSATGRAYFALVRPVHRRLVPFMLSRMAQRTDGSGRRSVP